MAYSLYDAAVTPCVQQLGALAGIIDKAAAHCATLCSPLGMKPEPARSNRGIRDWRSRGRALLWVIGAPQRPPPRHLYGPSKQGGSAPSTGPRGGSMPLLRMRARPPTTT